MDSCCVVIVEEFIVHDHCESRRHTLESVATNRPQHLVVQEENTVLLSYVPNEYLGGWRGLFSKKMLFYHAFFELT